MRKHMLGRRHTTLPTVLFLVVILLSAHQSPANAADGQRGDAGAVSVVAEHGSGPTPLTIQPGTHRCLNFGNFVDGYMAGHCASIDTFTNSEGKPAVRAQGQSFCQRTSNAVIVQCAAIIQEVKLYDSTTGVDSLLAITRCGARIGHAPCPAGRFQNLSPGVYLYCNHRYWALISTTIYLPVSGSGQAYGWWNSESFFPLVNCIIPI